MSSHYDVIVAGIGSMGAATCCHLAKRGGRILGLEKEAIPHGLGAHHGHSRMIRLAYYEHPDYVPLLQRAFDLWEQLEAESTYDLLHLTGGLYMGPPDASIITGSLESSQKHNLDHRILSRQDIETEFPSFRIPSDWVGFHERKAGYLVPEKAVCAHVEQALKAGAEIKGHEGLLEWTANAN
ncbi:MAG: FAD-dependent oxidoreductase, partial [Verrucomicrobiota bacterium]